MPVIIENHKAFYQSVKFTSDGFVTIGWNNKVSFYSESGRLISENDITQYYPKKSDWPPRVKCMDVSPDSTTLAFAGSDGLVHVFDIGSNSFTHKFTFNHMIHDPSSKTIDGYTNVNVESVCWSKDCQYLYVGVAHYVYKVGMDNSIAQILTLVKSNNSQVNTIKISTDRIIIGTWDKYLYVFDHDGNKLAQERMSCFVKAIGISEDTKTFYVSIGNDRNVLLIKYNLESGAMIDTVVIKSTSWVNGIVVKGDSVYLASNDDAIYQYSIDSLEYITHKYYGFCHAEGIEVSYDGSKLITFDCYKVIYH